MKTDLIFIAVVLLASPIIWSSSKLWRGRMMIIVTLLVLLWIAPFSLLMMLVVATLQWLLWRSKNRNFRKLKIIISICLPILPLIMYKLGHKMDNWLIPLGLSYYAFRQIHVAFEEYKGNASKLSLEDYLQYLFFLPVILVGPIHRLAEMQRSIRRLKWNPLYFSEGLERILYGLVKVSFLGNYLFSNKLPAYAETISTPFLKTYVHLIAFTGNTYMQFSGYSDLAIGMALLWGIRVMENFNYPFLATNMQDFWQRWHISLSTWCRDYVFQPIVAFSRNFWIAIIASMLVLALWHEISMRYIVWGIFQAVLILAATTVRKTLPAFSHFINQNPYGKWLGRLWVLHAFAFSCLIISAENFHELGVKLNNLF